MNNKAFNRERAVSPKSKPSRMVWQDDGATIPYHSGLAKSSGLEDFLRLVRAGTAYVSRGQGLVDTYAANVPRPFVDRNDKEIGVRVERGSTNYIIQSDSDTGITTSATIFDPGFYTLSKSGGGTVYVNVVSGAAEGLTGLSDEGYQENTFEVTQGPFQIQTMFTNPGGYSMEVQLEKGLRRTSYIPTAGVAVSRPLEALVIANSNMPGDDDYVIAFDYTPTSLTDDNAYGGTSEIDSIFSIGDIANYFSISYQSEMNSEGVVENHLAFGRINSPLTIFSVKNKFKMENGKVYRFVVENSSKTGFRVTINSELVFEFCTTSPFTDKTITLGSIFGLVAGDCVVSNVKVFNGSVDPMALPTV